MIINFHPKEVLSNKGKQIIERLNKDNNHTVVLVDSLTIPEWKEIVKSDEPIIMVAPVYWWGAGYAFDKWIQEVFAFGFAYKYEADGNTKGLLNGRKFELHMTHGTPKAFAEPMRNSITERMQKGIFGFCDSSIDIHYYDLED